MSGKFRFHDVAALSAKLGRLHMLYRAVCALGPNDDVSDGGHGEENRQPPNEGPPVGGRQQRFLGAFDAPPGKEDSERDQYQAQNEDNWDDNKDHNADVWVAGVASKLHWQNEQPGEAGGGHQRDAQHADPVAEEQYEYGAFWIVVHSFVTLRARNSDQTSLLKAFGMLTTFVSQVESHARQLAINGMPYPSRIPTTPLISGRLRSRFVIHSLEFASH